MDRLKSDSPGPWAKAYYLASRAYMEALLRPYDLGPTQWAVLWQLANKGPTARQELLVILHVEKPTLTEVVAALVNKGLVEQIADPHDQRQRILKIMPAGTRLWRKLPDPIESVLNIAFSGFSTSDRATAVRVLRGATERLNEQLNKGVGT
jgi:MarR family transcriptional regulator, lower aerobic nicotinate degradation pathway regulator